ncbi:MAG: DUF1893 domain-containing protein [Oscillospiraceae bacterium]|nr:DUF1893 domain-containing protein [Oscillospiraceae bacterium]
MIASTTCELRRGEQILISEETGLRPLLGWLSDPAQPLRGAFVYDRVIGKAAALLLAYGGAVGAQTPIISAPAAAVLRAHGIPYEAEYEVPFIQNRTGDGMCPMEQKVWDIDSPGAAYRVLSGQ